MAVLEDAVPVTVCDGDTLFNELELTGSLYYLLSGEIMLKHQDGRERVITADFHWLPIVQFQTESFSAVAITDCQLLKLNRKKLDNLLTWSQAADYLEIDIAYNREFDDDAGWMISILNSNLFYKIPPLNVFSIFEKVSAITVNAGETVLQQGEAGDYCYFIKEGSAQVMVASEAGAQPQAVAEIGMGRCFGEDALINKTVRNATVTMQTDGILMRLHRDDFAALLESPNVDNVSITTLDAIDSDNVQLLDVRTQEEFDHRHIRDAIHIPLTLLRLKIRLLDKDKQYLIYCNTGARSAATAFLLAQKGFNVSILHDGLSGISQQQVDQLLVSEYEAIHQLASGHY